MNLLWHESERTDDKSINSLDIGIAHMDTRTSTDLIAIIVLTGPAIHLVAKSQRRCHSE
jgi:hypothetical protein